MELKTKEITENQIEYVEWSNLTEEEIHIFSTQIELLYQECSSVTIFPVEFIFHQIQTGNLHAVKDKNDKISGAVMVIHSGEKDAEICGLIVRKDSRGKGLGEELFNKALQQIQDKNVLVQTTNDIVKEWCKSKKFEVVSGFGIEITKASWGIVQSFWKAKVPVHKIIKFCWEFAKGESQGYVALYRKLNEEEKDI